MKIRLHDKPDENDETLRHDGYRNLPSLARDHVDDWHAEQRSLYRAEHYRLLADPPNSQRRTNEERPTTRGKDSDYRELREHRPLCNRPKGLKMKAGDAAEYAVVRCQLCEGCKLWARMLDQERLGELIKRPVWFEVSENRYQSIRHKIKDEGIPYFTAPLKEDRRAVIVESGFRPTDENGERIPVELVEDMATLLSKFDHDRDRTQGRHGRRVSTGGMRSRKALEREIYQEKRAETKPETEAIREVVGTFSPPRQLAEMGDLSKAGEWLGMLCDSIGVEWERSPIGIVVQDTDPLDKVLKVHKGRALWRTDDPPPEFYDQRALFLEEVAEFPPEYQEFRQRVSTEAIDASVENGHEEVAA